MPSAAAPNTIRAAGVSRSRARLRFRPLASLLLIACCAGLLAAGQAHAVEPGYKEAAPLGGSFWPKDIDTEASTGNVFVVNWLIPAAQVDVYGPDGATGAGPIVSFGQSDFTGTPSGIAVDQGNGDVYVYDSGGGIARYTSDGLTPPTYTKDATYSAPAMGSDPGQVGFGGARLAVDPSNHDLLVADNANARVSRYAQDGSFKSSFNGADTAAGQFSGPIDLALDADGDIYVVDATGDLLLGGGTSRVEQFDSAGVTQGQLPAFSPSAVTTDPSTQRVVVAGDVASTHPRLYIFDDQGVLVGGRALPDNFFFHSVPGLAIDSSQHLYAGRAYGFSGSGGVTAFNPVVYPDVTVDVPSAITGTGAHLSGTVDPGGVQASAHFEYSTNGVDWTSTPDQDAGTTAGTVQDDISGLTPNTAYQLRLVAANADVSSTSDEVTFTTAKVAPAVATGSASSVTTTTARLNGTVDPVGDPSTYHFEYGLDASYGQRVPAVDAAAGDGRTPRLFSRQITGLTAGATYHYRIVATNSVGTTDGADRTFTTPGGQPDDARGFEMVSPVDKSGSAVRPRASHRSSLTGDSVVFTMKTPIGRAAESGTFQPRYFAKRGPTGWSFMSLDPPQITTPDRNQNIAYTRVMSPDNSKALVASNKALAPGGVEGQGNLYVRDTATGDYTFVATSDVPGLYKYLVGTDSESTLVAHTSDDFETLLFNSNVPLLPGADQGLYEWSQGTLKAVGVLPDGNSVVAFQAAASSNSPDMQNMSKDGRRVFFISPDVEGLFMRQDGTSTVPISVSHRDGDTQEARPAIYYGSSDDGSVVYFTSYHGLIDGMEEFVPTTLYRYDVDADELTKVAEDVSRKVQVAGDGHYVYYVTNSPGLYLWHDGATHSIANLSGFLNSTYLVSPNGKYFTFNHPDKLTDYDNADPGCPGDFHWGSFPGVCSQIYLYDAEADTLVCASCNPDGSRPTGDASAGEAGQPTFSYEQRIVLDSGRVFFDTPDRLVDWDSGGSSDVYMYDHGQVTLISGGKPGYDSHFADSDLTGDNVFFTTDERLVGQDTDNLIDEYVSRVGGGLPSQNPPPPPAPCSGEGCLGSPGSAPSREPAGTVGFTGDGNVVQPGPVRVSLSRKTVRGIRAAVRVRAPRRGRIALSGRHVKSVRRSVSKAGTVTLRFSLTGKARKALERKHRLRVEFKVTFVPAGGQRSTATAGITFRTSEGGAR